jgi:hypothetical protein
MTASRDNRPTAIRMVLPFVFRHWLEQPVGAAVVAGGLLGATVADLFMPLFSGHLVDAMTSGAADPAARRAAIEAFGAIVGLGLVAMILRLIGLQAIVPFTLRIMSDVARELIELGLAARHETPEARWRRRDRALARAGQLRAAIQRRRAGQPLNLDFTDLLQSMREERDAAIRGGIADPGD